MGATEDEAIAALLHDAIEDAPAALGADTVRRWIGFQFGSAVLDIVEGCTDSAALNPSALDTPLSATAQRSTSGVIGTSVLRDTVSLFVLN